MESVYRNLGIFNQAHAYHAMVDLYNQRIEQENSVITQQRRIIKEEKSNVKKENKNHFTQLSYSDAFETINKQKSSQKIISNLFTKKIIKTRQNITASQSTFKSYETFTIPCYDGWYQDKMRKI
jgi:Zn-dependent metalloprotease